MNTSNHNLVAIVGATLIFIAASALPCFGDTLFEDDFDDNDINYAKWSEIHTDGIWQEVNQRVEFEVQEPGSGKNKEGISSIGFQTELSTAQGVVFSWDQITNIGSTGWVGQVNVRITDGTNYIRIRYIRGNNTVLIRDSNDASEWTFITHDDGTWSNEIRIYSDRYSIKIDEDETGWISDAIFPSNPTVSVEIYIENGGSTPSFNQRSGFDNVLVETIGELEYEVATYKDKGKWSGYEQYPLIGWISYTQDFGIGPGPCNIIENEVYFNILCAAYQEYGGWTASGAYVTIPGSAADVYDATIAARRNTLSGIRIYVV